MGRKLFSKKAYGGGTYIINTNNKKKKKYKVEVKHKRKRKKYKKFIHPLDGNIHNVPLHIQEFNELKKKALSVLKKEVQNEKNN